MLYLHENKQSFRREKMKNKTKNIIGVIMLIILVMMIFVPILTVVIIDIGIIVSLLLTLGVFVFVGLIFLSAHLIGLDGDEENEYGKKK